MGMANIYLEKIAEEVSKDVISKRRKIINAALRAFLEGAFGRMMGESLVENFSDDPAIARNVGAVVGLAGAIHGAQRSLNRDNRINELSRSEKR